MYTITQNSIVPLTDQHKADPYIYIPMQPPAPHIQLQADEPVTSQPSIPEPFAMQDNEESALPPEDPIFASLFEKVEPVELPDEQSTQQKKENITRSTNGDIEIHSKDTVSTTALLETDPTPPDDVATDDIPIPFIGTNTTNLTDRDTLFHQFIKAVNTALYTSMHQSDPPYSTGVQPVFIRMVIVRTGRLAQAPTILRSSGNPQRDAWYVNAIQRASAQFPPIPPAIHLPFAELTYKEGMHAGKPVR